MTKKELETKVINAQATVTKKKAIIEKHREQLAKLIAKGADNWDINSKRRDIEEAIKKLTEAEQVAKNWEDKLGAQISRDAFIEANTPQIIKDFLENWKASAIEYYRKRRIEFIEYKKELRQKERDARLEALRTLPELEKAREIYKDRDLSDFDLANLWPRKAVEAFLGERGLDYRSIREKLAARSDSVTVRLLDIRDDAEREAWLENAMEEEKKAKLADLIGRINKVVGTITDASGLYIGSKGEINGYVVGTEGKAKIETIGAGGYNIVCFHFRTLVHEFK